MGSVGGRGGTPGRQFGYLGLAAPPRAAERAAAGCGVGVSRPLMSVFYEPSQVMTSRTNAAVEALRRNVGNLQVSPPKLHSVVAARLPLQCSSPIFVAVVPPCEQVQIRWQQIEIM